MAVLLRSLFTLLLTITLTLGDTPQKPLSSDSHPLPQKRIAIIGAGSAGASTAYYLSKFSTASGIPLDITVFERNSYVGGRSTTLDVYDDPAQTVELGASIFVEVNSNLLNAAKEFNLSLSSFDRTTRADGKQVLGVWDGEQFVMTQILSGASRLEDIWQKAKLLLRYGLAPLNVIKLMKETVGRFLRMYEAPIFPFKDLTEAVYAVGLQNTTGVTGTQLLKSKNLDGLFAEEVVQASTRVNYAQNLAYIHGLEAMVCMATDGAMSIEGGNWRIFEGMVNASRATLMLNSPVSRIRKTKSGSYAITRFDTKLGEPTSDERFDAVVLASPYQFSSLEFESEEDEKPLKVPDEIPYVQLHVTILASPRRINPRAFRLADEDVAPDIILTTLQLDEEPSNDPSKIAGKARFFSLSTLRTVKNPAYDPPREEYLYKVFSPKRAHLEDLRAILGVDPPHPPLFSSTSPWEGPDDDDIVANPSNQITYLHRHAWHSYPYLAPRVTFETLNLDEESDGMLYYTSGIESFISTMETSSLMGMNVARLIVDRFVKQEREERTAGGKGAGHEGGQKKGRGEL